MISASFERKINVTAQAAVMWLTPDFTKDFIYPSIVAVVTAFLAYFGAYNVRQKLLKDENVSKTKDLADAFVIEIDKLLALLGKLREDLERYNYFTLQTCNLANNTISKLKSLNDRIFIFPDDELRRAIIENVDLASSVIEEINSLESILVNEQTKLNASVKEAEKEFRKFRLDILNQGVLIDNGLAQYFDVKKSKTKPDKHLEVIQNIYDNLLTMINRGELDTLRQSIEKKRNSILVQLLDIQTKLRQLKTDILHYREQD